MIDLYLQPYGDEQQLNLNWIINEIINLHKQLDPDYETPSFTQVYPYSNLNRLNLDWVLSELKALKELAPEPVPTIDIQAVAEALVALPFDSNTPYQIYDFISKDGEIWRATEAIAAGSDWDETQWYKTKLGTDLAVLERWINTINNSLTSEIQARQDADTALQTNIDNEALARQQADTALQNTINGLTSADISDDSDAGGANVKASLNALRGSLNTLQSDVTNLESLLTTSTQQISQSSTEYYTITEIIRCITIAKICFVTGEIKCIAPRTDAVITLATGLPKPISPANFFANAWGANSGSKQPLSINVPMASEETSNLRISYGEANSYYPFTLSYIIA